MTRGERSAIKLAESVKYMDMIRPRKIGKPGDLSGSWVCGCEIQFPRADNELKFRTLIPCPHHEPCLLFEKAVK
jgi:hypothetical protein